MQVSRLLSTIFVVSVSAESISLPLCTGKALSASHWAAYFHQASVGSYMHYQYLSSVKGNNESGNSKVSKVCYQESVLIVYCVMCNACSLKNQYSMDPMWTMEPYGVQSLVMGFEV